MKTKTFIAALLCLSLTSIVTAAEPLHVHIISGSKEYKSEESLKAFTSSLKASHNIEWTASWARDGAKELENLDALKSADLMIVFARRMKLNEDQMRLIRNHWESGKPTIGIRTAGHAFQKEDNELFDRKVLGGHYSGHYGNEVVKVLTTDAGDSHPILNGVGSFTSKKLYKCGELPETTTVLQIGDIGKAQHPVTIVNQYEDARVFFTALGVPSDFENEHFRRMLLNAICWTTNCSEQSLRK